MAGASDEPAAVDPTASDDPLLLYFTSGTTGTPKWSSKSSRRSSSIRLWRRNIGPDDERFLMLRSARSGATGNRR